MTHATSDSSWLDRIEAACEQHVTALASDVAHDPEHTRRVVANARYLARAEGADLDVVVPAAWLHDCVAVPKNSPDRRRASALAAAEATRLLGAWGMPPELVPRIAHAIEAHSYSAAVPAQTLEARVLQDADRLDALGSVGIARCLMLGGELGRPLYLPADPFCEHRDPDDLAATIDHFYAKLLRLAADFQTESGRAEAARRTQVLQVFLTELARELAWGRRPDERPGG